MHKLSTSFVHATKQKLQLKSLPGGIKVIGKKGMTFTFAITTQQFFPRRALIECKLARHIYHSNQKTLSRLIKKLVHCIK